MNDSPYLQARRRVAAALDAEQDARIAWLAEDASSHADRPAWDAYQAAGIVRAEAERELSENFDGEMLASAARSQFYAPFKSFIVSKEDGENLTVAGFLGPAEVPFRNVWEAFCKRASLDPDFDPGAKYLTTA